MAANSGDASDEGRCHSAPCVAHPGRIVAARSRLSLYARIEHMISGDALNSIREQTVFVVDDDPAICESLCNLIESAGLITRQFVSAEEFLEVYSPELAGCLVLDVRL